MYKQFNSKKAAIRFRCWSRKAYAVFASLGKNVTIGCLRKNVTEQSLTKQPSLQAECPETFRELKEVREENSPVALTGIILNRQLVTIIQATTADAAPVLFVFTIIYYIIGVMSHPKTLLLFLSPIYLWN